MAKILSYNYFKIISITITNKSMELNFIHMLTVVQLVKKTYYLYYFSCIFEEQSLICSVTFTNYSILLSFILFCLVKVHVVTLSVSLNT